VSNAGLLALVVGLIRATRQRFNFLSETAEARAAIDAEELLG